MGGVTDVLGETARFRHDETIWNQFPTLAPGVLLVENITPNVSADAVTDRYLDVARARLAIGPESAMPEIQAWRRAFSALGLKPTQYRCASESLLRRLRTHGSLPRLHPLVDLCNAVSVAFAIPVAALDRSRIDGDLVVRHAIGDEDYLTFGGQIEHPEPGEVIFADQAGQAHARRWTNRQSGLSAVGASTTDVLVVTEALHAGAADDVARLTQALAGALAEVWSVTPSISLLNAGSPELTLR
jgi:DNA/RNA-binding domain of Phe-tRNA-synthetase-like protein